MKVRESHWREAAKDDKNDKPNRTNNDNAARLHQNGVEQSNAANKARQSDSPLKEETKFANFLESAPKLQKPNQRQEESSEQRNDDNKKEKKEVGREKDSSDLTGVNEEKTGKYESFGGSSGGAGGQSNFGAGANVGQLNLSENFAARSILHIADLERLVSTVRAQTSLGGRREIILQLKRSVLEGLQVKISTDAEARVQIEFLAANESVRSQVSAHAEELAGILRGRGINLGSLTTSLDADRENQNSPDAESGVSTLNSLSQSGADSVEENTFDTSKTSVDGKIYQA